MTAEPLNFNESVNYGCKYEGAIPLVRTGTVRTTPLDSFCNALLLSCSKKFIISDENDKYTSIEKLQTDFKIIYRESELFTTFFDTFNDNLIDLYNAFFSFINGGTSEPDDLLSRLLRVVFQEDDNTNNKNKIDYFITIHKDIITATDFRKVTNLQKRNVENIEEMKENLLKDFKQYIKFKLDNDTDETSRVIKFNAILLIDAMVDVIMESLSVPEFNPTKTCNTMYDIASKHFQINIFILNSKDDFIVYYTNEYNPNYKSIILLSYECNTYFEVIGKLRQGNIINRQFLPYEDVIQSIMYYLRSPKQHIPML